MGVSHTSGPHFGSPYNKDHNIFGSILGPPVYGSPHIPGEENVLVEEMGWETYEYGRASAWESPG